MVTQGLTPVITKNLEVSASWFGTMPITLVLNNILTLFLVWIESKEYMTHELMFFSNTLFIYLGSIAYYFHYVVHTIFKLMILLAQPPMC